MRRISRWVEIVVKQFLQRHIFFHAAVDLGTLLSCLRAQGAPSDLKGVANNTVLALSFLCHDYDTVVLLLSNRAQKQRINVTITIIAP